MPSPTTTTLIDSDVFEQQLLRREIQALLLDKLSIRVESAEMDLLETGVLDSLAQVQLLLHLEKHFGLRLPMEALEVESFLSVANMAELVAASKRAQSPRPSVPDPETGGPENLAAAIQNLLLEKLAVGVDDADMDLFQTGIFDSMTLVQFILSVEEQFDIRLPMEDLDIDFFHSVNKIAETVGARIAAASKPRSLNATRG
jgi:D-alanine--poly(phosphoribitol) ligase subunit 2